MGWLPVWAGVAALAPLAVNALAQAPGLNRLAKELAGVDQRRHIPVFAHQTFQRWFAGRMPRGDGSRGDVVLWPDTFTNHFHPGIALAAVELMEAAGWRVQVPARRVCCGLTWISTGQLGVAEAVIRRTVRVLRPHLRAGTRIVGLEPSCTAVFRSDAYEMFPDDQDVQRLRDQTLTLAELLDEHSPGWQPPTVPGRALIQTHCHQHAILGTAADRSLLRKAGVDPHFLDSGCCGLAGNFGFERGHYEVSEACAERVLLPAVRDADAHDVILADGFSCRTQIEQGASGGRVAVHLAELLRAGLRADAVTALPERRWAHRPVGPPRRARIAAAGAAGLSAAVATTAAAAWLARAGTRGPGRRG